MPRTRLTGFSRLLIFLLIALPIVYFGAAYYNGEDPVGQLKQLFGGQQTTTEVVERTTPDGLDELRAENERLRTELARCRTAGTNE